MTIKQKHLHELNQKMAEECQCALKSTAINVVPGEGNADADILFIGEAPGKKEDEQGKPFIGAAGKFLNEMLASIGLKREDIYITNVVKYRPPGNRDPLPDEVADCLPWLEAQIQLIKPKLIVPLGRHAMERFLKGKKISEVHGQLFEIKMPHIGKRNFYTLYHPAAALYNGSMRKVLLEDFSRIPKLLKKIQ
ncbi:MAG: uracil-DNA glycosylase [Candidatus Moranbacteria bacterium]|nr:uracil-DNA glycosylase [Candidatus Moranbacteria bacterium]